MRSGVAMPRAARVVSAFSVVGQGPGRDARPKREADFGFDDANWYKRDAKNCRASECGSIA